MAKLAGNDPFSGEIVWTEQEVLAGVERITDAVAQEYLENYTVLNDRELMPIFVPILKGAGAFAAALQKSLASHPEHLHPDFAPITLSTYNALKNERRPRVTEEIDERLIYGRHAHQLDDILDSGDTARFNMQHLLDLGAASVSTIVLVDRINPDREIQASAAVFRTERKDWFIGWGMNDDALPGDGGRSLRGIRVSPNNPH